MNNLTRIRAILYILSWKAVLDGRAYPWSKDCRQSKWGEYESIRISLRS